jgi:hypothetical protein
LPLVSHLLDPNVRKKLEEDVARNTNPPPPVLYAAGKELENLTGTAVALAVKVGLRLW